MLRASVFVFECFVFETTLGDGLSSFSKDNSANYLVKKKCSEAFRGVHNLRNVREKTYYKSNLVLVVVLVLESKGL